MRLCLLLLIFVLVGCQMKSIPSTNYDVMIKFPSDHYPNIAKHIRKAVTIGKPDTCTINRGEVQTNMIESFKGIPTKKGYERFGFPMSICLEGGPGADVTYINSKESKEADLWIASKIKGYKDGTIVKWIVP